MQDTRSLIEDKRKIINNALNNILNDRHFPGRLVQAMKYSLMAGGKRIRPILFLSAIDAINCEYNESIINAACALEMIHTYSLIHDDLPAMDNDNMRRGKPTCHVKFDEATAILAGDALLTYAFDILSSVEANSLFDACKWLKLVNVISSAAGHKGMIEGQMLDMQNEGRLISLEELKTMHFLKTGELIQASVVAGGILGNGSAEQINSLNIYGKYVGLAFQVSDDILNVEGDPALTGKSVGTDAIKRKNTYPALIGLKESKIFANDLVNCALQALNQFDKKADLLRKIAVYIVERKN